MVESTWPELGGKRLRYADRTWELTGTVDVKGTGEILEVDAIRADDVRHSGATLRFGLEDPPASLNPGDLGEHFDRLVREGGHHVLEVKKGTRTYRYQLQGMEYD